MVTLEVPDSIFPASTHMQSETTTRSGKRFYAQLTVLIIIVLVALLRPRIQAWLDAPSATSEPPSVGAAISATSDTPSALETRFPEQDSSQAAKTSSQPSSGFPGVSAGSRAVTQATPGDQTSDGWHGRTPGSQPNRYGTSTGAGTSGSEDRLDKSPSGKLRLIGNNVFRSTAGLIYRPGSRDQHRLKHILKHATDDLSKPVHGVFDGDRDQILAWIDIAWLKANQGGRAVRRHEENGRTAWTVRMDERIGYVGGQTGQRKNHPDCRYLRLLIEDGKTVVTAYPTSSF